MLDFLDFLQDKYGLKKVNRDLFYGTYNGFHSLIHFEKSSGLFWISIGISGNENNELLISVLSSMKKDRRIVNFEVKTHHIRVSMKNLGLKNGIETKISSVYEELISFLSNNGYTSGCFITGENALRLSPYQVNDVLLLLSDNAVELVRSKLEDKQASIQRRNENVPLGIIGALLGALLGAGIWLGIGLLGYIVYLAGLAIIVLSFYGYKLFAGKMSKIGAFFSLIFSVAAVILANITHVSIEIYKHMKPLYDVTFMRVFQESFSLVWKEPEVKNIFLKNTAIGLLFVLIAGFIALKGMYSSSVGKYTLNKLD